LRTIFDDHFEAGVFKGGAVSQVQVLEVQDSAEGRVATRTTSPDHHSLGW
jgi:hypothetical protein